MPVSLRALGSVGAPSSGADFTRRSPLAAILPQSQAASESDVTSQLGAISGSARTIRVGIQTGVTPLRISIRNACGVAAGARPACSAHSIRPNCSIASSARWWAAVSSNPQRAWAART